MVSLFKHQEEAVNNLVPLMENDGFAYLQGAERIGKTHIVMTLAERLGVNSVLFVTAKGAIPSIAKDYKDGGYSFDMYTINYESLIKVTKHYDLIILDEAHKVSAFSINKVIKRVANHIHRYKPLYRLAMSATPASEHDGQWYHQMMLLGFKFDKDCSSSYKAHRVHGIPHLVSRGGGIKVETYKVWDKSFTNMFQPHIVAISRSDANFVIPEVTISKVPIEPSRAIYEAYRAILEKPIVFDTIIDSQIKKFSKLSQITGGFFIRDDNHVQQLECNKLAWILQQPGDKIVIYAYFVAEVSFLASALRACLVPSEFANSSDRYLVVQQTRGALGIDLSYVDAHIFYSFGYSGSTFVQATNRQLNKRRETQAVVSVLVTSGTIEEEAFAKVSNKRSYTLASFKKQIYQKARSFND